MKIQKMIFNSSQVPEERKYEIFEETEAMEDSRIEEKRRKSLVKSKRTMSKKFEHF